MLLYGIPGILAGDVRRGLLTAWPWSLQAVIVCAHCGKATLAAGLDNVGP